VAEPKLSRRTLLLSGIGAAVAAVLAACSGAKRTPTGVSSPTTTATPTTTPTSSRSISPATLEPTPSCVDGDEATPDQTEGPYFTRNLPEKTNLRADVRSGTRLVLTGAVVSTACVPVRRALVDFWHCDDGGNYDNSGFKLRGHQFTDAKGAWHLDTILPGIYTGRTRHIHVKVQAPNKPVLTTQLYFPNEPANASDGIFRQECVIEMHDAADGKAGSFTFVLDL
jgi:protocatechuate 3,4-dioxygenase beta subunit